MCLRSTPTVTQVTVADFAVDVAAAGAAAPAAAVLSGGMVKLTLAAAVTAGQAVTVAYTKSATTAQNIQEYWGNTVGSFSAFTASNLVGYALPYLTAATIADGAPKVITLTFSASITQGTRSCLCAVVRSWLIFY